MAGAGTSDRDGMDGLASALKSDASIVRHHAEVSAEIDGGVVRLRGEAGHMSVKRRAVALARKHLHGKYRVVDELRRDVTKRVGDRELGNTVAERLAQEGAFKAYGLVIDRNGTKITVQDPVSKSHRITVSSTEDTVTLSGTVGSLTHMRLAEVIAWWTGACAIVINELEVVPAEEDNDNELTDAVRMTLEKDPLVDVGQVHVGTAAGVVHVEGLTMNERQRDSVIEDIWLVPGVVDVVDRIEAGSGTAQSDGV